MFDVVVFTGLRGHRARAVIAAGAVIVVASVAVIVVAVTWSSAPGGSSCSAAYSVSKQWVTGFTASIKVTSGSSAIRSWTLRYTYAGGERLAMGWDGTWGQSGDTVTVSNASWNGSLAPGSSARIGANFDNQGTSSAPSAVSCTGTRTGTGTGAQAAPSVSVSAPAPSASSSQSPGASAGTFSQALINSAVAGPLIAFKAPSASDHRPAPARRPLGRLRRSTIWRSYRTRIPRPPRTMGRRRKARCWRRSVT